MNNTLAVVLAAFVLAPASGRGDTSSAFPEAAVAGRSAPLSADQQAKRYDRAALRAQLASDAPGVRRQAAAVGGEIAARALAELEAVVTQPIQLRLEHPVGNSRRPDAPRSRRPGEAPAALRRSNPRTSCSQWF